MDWRVLGVALLVGVLGFGLAWGTWHLWVDHQQHHAMLNAMIQAQQQRATPGLPPPPQPERRP